MEPWILRGMAGTLLIPNSTMSSALAGLHGAQGGKDGPPSLACMPHPGAKGTSCCHLTLDYPESPCVEGLVL